MHLVMEITYKLDVNSILLIILKSEFSKSLIQAYYSLIMNNLQIMGRTLRIFRWLKVIRYIKFILTSISDRPYFSV